MYNYVFILFTASITGKQVFYVGPVVINGFWQSFVKENANTQNKIPEENWIISVPPVLKSKIAIYEGNYIPFNELIQKTNLQNPSIVTYETIYPKNIPFDPKDIIQLLKDNSII